MKLAAFAPQPAASLADVAELDEPIRTVNVLGLR